MLGLGKKKAEAIYGKKLKHPEKESEEQLSVITASMLMHYRRIIDDSIRIVRTTRNVDTKQDRIDLCQARYQDIQVSMISETENKLRKAGII